MFSAWCPACLWLCGERTCLHAWSPGLGELGSGASVMEMWGSGHPCAVAPQSPQAQLSCSVPSGTSRLCGPWVQAAVLVGHFFARREETLPLNLGLSLPQGSALMVGSEVSLFAGDCPWSQRAQVGLTFQGHHLAG